MFAAVRIWRILFSRDNSSPVTTACVTGPVEKFIRKSVWLSQIPSSVIQDLISRLMTVELSLAKRGGVAIESRVERP